MNYEKLLNINDIGRILTYTNSINEQLLGRLKSFDNAKQIAYLVFFRDSAFTDSNWKQYRAFPIKYTDIFELQD
jgi:hypothetical protein